ncbi:unnamed protein product, partial [Amoebophrya sp. A25]
HRVVLVLGGLCVSCVVAAYLASFLSPSTLAKGTGLQERDRQRVGRASRDSLVSFGTRGDRKLRRQSIAWR